MQIFTRQPFAFFILLLLTFNCFSALAQQKHTFEGIVKDTNGQPLERAGVHSTTTSKNYDYNKTVQFIKHTI